EPQHPPAILTTCLMLAAREAPEPALDGPGIGRDLDGVARPMDQLVCERQPASAVGDPARDVFAPGEARGRKLGRCVLGHGGTTARVRARSNLAGPASRGAG